MNEREKVVEGKKYLSEKNVRTTDVAPSVLVHQVGFRLCDSAPGGLFLARFEILPSTTITLFERDGL